MQFKKVLPYNIKRRVRRAVLATGLAGATLVGCKDKIEPTIEPFDVELRFTLNNADSVLAFPELQKYIDNTTVRTIYMIPELDIDWITIVPSHLPVLRQKFFQPRFDMSPKVRGKGCFYLRQGVASKAPDDSLWFVQQGWQFLPYPEKSK